jgi:hypothetical protein
MTNSWSTVVMQHRAAMLTAEYCTENAEVAADSKQLHLAFAIHGIVY